MSNTPGKPPTIYRRSDGMIVISMKDGSSKVVTPESYQKMYHKQQRILRERLRSKNVYLKNTEKNK